MTEELIYAILEPIVLESKYPEEWNLDKAWEDLAKITSAFKGRLSYTDEEKADLDDITLKEDVIRVFKELYDEKEAEIGAEQMREVERMIMLRVVDNRWMDHIDAMEQLKSGIGLRSIGQQDPAQAYAKEGFDMFDEMVADIREETVKFCYNVTVTTRTERRRGATGTASKEEYHEDHSEGPEAAPTADRTGKQETVHRAEPKVGRNDPCPCGSGKKYKNCCGR